jgi:ABC-2 type transport system permease protein
MAYLKNFIPAPYRAVCSKEYKLFTRDMTQAVQLILLLGLCLIYLYNFQILSSSPQADETLDLWWKAFLVIAKLVMGAFVVTAVCARFVFPSVSLEGRAFWILQTSPNSLESLLRVKFWFWFLPIAAISSIIFTSGALAIHADIRIVIVHALGSWVLCYGIVGLAIGFGAVFSNFQWDNSAQLTTSFGSFLYLIVSSLFVLLSITPIAVMIILRTLHSLGFNLPNTLWYGIMIICAASVVGANYFIAHYSIVFGKKALEKSAIQG